MNIEQREQNWNKRYLENDTPWEEERPSTHLKDVFDNYATGKTTLLDVGCGLGINALWFSELGFNVDATDISEECVTIAQNKNRGSSTDLKFYQSDFLNSKPSKKYDIVFDKGCLHSFTTQDSYNIFAEKVSHYLNEGGIWITISGNSDNPDDLEKRKNQQFPRLSLRNIAFAVEPHFEILDIKRSQFGEKNSFYSWLGVFKKREFFYE